MRNRISAVLLSTVVFTAPLGITGCERDTTGLDLAPFPTDPVVFRDVFNGIDYQAFAGSKLDALSVDTDEHYLGDASIKITVPDVGYAGGAITANAPRDLSQYNAVAFWVKASMAATLDIAGYGNDNTDALPYQGSVSNIPLTTTWQRHILPIPRTGLMTPERGLFFFSEGPENGLGYDIWFDEIEFVKSDAISNPRPVMRQDDVGTVTGVQFSVGGTFTAFDVTVPAPATLQVNHAPAYFTFLSSDESVAMPSGGGIRVVGGGTADITAQLGAIAVAGRFTVRALDPPTDPAPRPTIPAANVISIFSNAYTNRPANFSPSFSQASVSEIKISGDNVKVYNIPTALDVAVIDFGANTIDATAMTHVHIDIWAPEGTFFGLGLFSFGADGVFSGEPVPSGDDSQKLVAVVPPQLVFGEWLSLDLPLSSYTVPGGLKETAHLAQIILRSDSVLLLVDNIFFYNAGN
jgi:hypothetical protein